MQYIIIACICSVGIGAALKWAYDFYTQKERVFFTRVKNYSRKFGEDLEYDWLLETEKGNLAFTDEQIEEARRRGERQKNDLLHHKHRKDASS